MEQKELSRAVAERSGLSREESADIARAVLEALTSQLSDGEARRLAEDVPGELAAELRARRPRRTEARPIPVHDLIRQLSQRTGVTEEEARTGASAVLAVLRGELGEEGYRHLTAQLPREYAELAEASS
jgi:uncharacterized protein (DUF2267 family)